MIYFFRLRADKELKESDQVKFEVEEKVHRMILNSVTPSDAALYTAKAHNTAGSVSCNGRVKIQRKYFFGRFTPEERTQNWSPMICSGLMTYI